MTCIKVNLDKCSFYTKSGPIGPHGGQDVCTDVSYMVEWVRGLKVIFFFCSMSCLNLK